MVSEVIHIPDCLGIFGCIEQVRKFVTHNSFVMRTE